MKQMLETRKMNLVHIIGDGGVQEEEETTDVGGVVHREIGIGGQDANNPVV